MTLVPLLLLAVPLQFAKDVNRDFVLSGNNVYGFLLPVQVVSDAAVQDARWSPDGAYALVKRHQPKVTAEDITKLIEASAKGQGGPMQAPIEVSLSVWNKKTGKTTELYRRIADPQSIQDVEWVPKSSSVVAEIVTVERSPRGESLPPQTAIVEFDVRSGASRTLASVTDGALILMTSPTENLTALISMQIASQPEGKFVRNSSVRFYSVGGKVSPAIDLPTNAAIVGWHDGRTLALHVRKTDDPQEGVLNPVLLDSRTGQMREVKGGAWPQRSNFAQNQEVGDLKLSPPFYRPEPTVRGLLLSAKEETSPNKGALVTMEAEYAEISPAKDGVLYVTRGVALFRPIVAVPKEVYENARKAAERAEAMSRAKQVALGMIMFASDHDDNLPGNGSDWQNNVSPYLKNDSLFNGFNYTFGGGNMSQIERPSDTELGHIPLDGGRVVAYCDGHVKWVPDK